MVKVLVTGAGALLGQGIIKSLRLAAHPYHIIAADPDPRAVGLYWADTACLIPLATAVDYLDCVTDLLAQEKPDVLLVGTDVELLVFAENKAALESEYGVKVVVSPPDVIKIADDKWLTSQFLVSNGFPHPQSALPENREQLLAQCDFPLVVKPRVGARSVGVNLVHNEQELAAALRQVENPVIQENVASAAAEYTSGVVMANGRVQAIVTMRRDLRNGNTYRAYVEPDSAYDSLLCVIAEKLGGDGPLNFQFRVADGLPKIFEINARFSGTTPFRAYAGFNEVDAVVRQVLWGEPVAATAVNPVIILRYWNEIVIDTAEMSTLTTQGRLTSPHWQKPNLL